MMRDRARRAERAGGRGAGRAADRREQPGPVTVSAAALARSAAQGSMADPITSTTTPSRWSSPRRAGRRHGTGAPRRSTWARSWRRWMPR
jgi:hypothetical protein